MPVFLYDQYIALDPVTSLLVQGAAGGTFSETPGGPSLPVTDVLGIPIAGLSTSAQGIGAPFLVTSDLAVGFATFGSFVLPIESREFRNAASNAQIAAAAATAAATAAQQAVLDAGQALTDARIALAASTSTTDGQVDLGITRAVNTATSSLAVALATKAREWIVTPRKTAGYTAALNEAVVVDTAATGFVVTLPTATVNSKIRVVNVALTGSNLCTINSTSTVLGGTATLPPAASIDFWCPAAGIWARF